MKAYILLIAMITGISLNANSTDQPVAIRNVKLLEEKVIQNDKDNEKNNWERWSGERRWERRGWERRWERQ